MTKLYIVVDEHDNIINYKPKEDIHPQNEWYRVSVLRLTNSKGEILLAQRAHNKKHNPGNGGPAVAGTVEQGNRRRTMSR
jgi:isopentenyldiphosphate isomerase